jgi:hypothetical protein
VTRRGTPVCDGRAYSYGHLAGVRHWVLILPSGERLTLCSPECAVNALCEPRPTSWHRDDRSVPVAASRGRRGPLERLR